MPQIEIRIGRDGGAPLTQRGIARVVLGLVIVIIGLTVCLLGLLAPSALDISAALQIVGGVLIVVWGIGVVAAVRAAWVAGVVWVGLTLALQVYGLARGDGASSVAAIILWGALGAGLWYTRGTFRRAA